jgi:hypothetical protein
VVSHQVFSRIAAHLLADGAFDLRAPKVALRQPGAVHMVSYQPGYLVCQFGYAACTVV